MTDDPVTFDKRSALLRQQTILAQFGEFALRCDSLDEILTEACRLVEGALNTQLAKVMEMQTDGDTLLVRAGVGWKPGIVGVVRLKVSDLTSEGHALKTGEPTTSPDRRQESRFHFPAFLIEHGVHAMANVLIPSRHRQSPFGILEVDSREPRQFTEYDLTFLRSYANLLAAAVDRLRAIDELHDREHQLRDTEARLDNAIAAAEMSTWHWDGNTGILRFFPSFEALHLRDSGIGVPLPQLSKGIHPGDQAKFHAAVQQALSGDNLGRLAVELRVLLPGGVVQLLRMTGNVEVADTAITAAGFTQDITESRRAEEHISHLAHHDGLTGLLNRQSLRERLNDALLRSQRGEGCAILALDLDRFKEVNDTLGHAVGDSVLRSVASRLLEIVRESDVVARPGGDEFIIIQFGLHQSLDAEALAMRIVASLSKPHEIEGQLVVIGCSIGIAFAPNDGKDVDTILNCADLALYSSKRNDNSRCSLFDPEMQARAQAQRWLTTDLKLALSRNEFELHYQPIVQLKKNSIIGFEALVRWRHPVHGLLPPSLFIPFAEETGLIEPIGEWILVKACQDASAWPSDVKLAVNLSVVQVLKGNIIMSVMMAMEQTGLSSQRLELEITESLFLHDSETTLAKLRHLREDGVSIVMDDFGVGYSSLGYISKFPFDKIKIDRHFVTNSAVATSGAAIIKAVSVLCRRLSITCLAEGIETRDQLRQVASLGCSEGQGNFFARPRPATDIASFLHEWTGGRGHLESGPIK